MIISCFGLTTSFLGWFAFVDFFLAAFPITIIRKLQLSLHKKIQLSLLLGLGVFAGICAVIKTTFLPTLTSAADFTWITCSLLEWNVNEVNVIIICASIPVIRPLFIKVKEVSKNHQPHLLHRNGQNNNSGPTPPPKDLEWTNASTDSEKTQVSRPSMHLAYQVKDSPSQPKHAPEHGRNLSTASTTIDDSAIRLPFHTNTHTHDAIPGVTEPMRDSTVWLDVEATPNRDDLSPAPENKIKRTTEMDVIVEQNPRVMEMSRHRPVRIGGDDASDAGLVGDSSKKRDTVPLPARSPLRLSVGEPFGVGELEGDGVGELDSQAVAREYAGYVV